VKENRAGALPAHRRESPAARPTATRY
jgi:hypothetical protein